MTESRKVIRGRAYRDGRARESRKDGGDDGNTDASKTSVTSRKRPRSALYRQESAVNRRLNAAKEVGRRTSLGRQAGVASEWRKA